MSRYENSIGVKVPEILLPGDGADFYKWSVVACDQFTSQPEYWQSAKDIAGDAPSTLNLILPEAYLGKPGEAERIEAVKRTMGEYLDSGALKALDEGFVLVRRSSEGKQRLGLVMALDLEHYDYNKGASTLIRATEGTIIDRIPPRLRIREGAPIELPHILVLIDDPGRSVIEPLLESIDELEPLYDTELMLDGGHISGHLVSKPQLIINVIDALTALKDTNAFEKKYGAGRAPMLFAMGDGNHSFATAKASWENIKADLSPEQAQTHPARYALVEIENLHDEGIAFEPIHRVVFGVEPEGFIKRLEACLKKLNGEVSIQRFDDEAGLNAFVLEKQATKAHALPFFHAGGIGALCVAAPKQQLAVGTLQQALDTVLAENAGGEVDYIHGKNVVLSLSNKADTVGFLLPAMKKTELFPTVIYDGALVRKTFSMGEANEKRYYMECRRILP